MWPYWDRTAYRQFAGIWMIMCGLILLIALLLGAIP